MVEVVASARTAALEEEAAQQPDCTRKQHSREAIRAITDAALTEGTDTESLVAESLERFRGCCDFCLPAAFESTGFACFFFCLNWRWCILEEQESQ